MAHGDQRDGCARGKHNAFIMLLPRPIFSLGGVAAMVMVPSVVQCFPATNDELVRAGGQGEDLWDVLVSRRFRAAVAAPGDGAVGQ